MVHSVCLHGDEELLSLANAITAILCGKGVGVWREGGRAHNNSESQLGHYSLFASVNVGSIQFFRTILMPYRESLHIHTSSIECPCPMMGILNSCMRSQDTVCLVASCILSWCASWFCFPL